MIVFQHFTSPAFHLAFYTVRHLFLLACWQEKDPKFYSTICHICKINSKKPEYLLLFPYSVTLRAYLNYRTHIIWVLCLSHMNFQWTFQRNEIDLEKYLSLQVERHARDNEVNRHEYFPRTMLLQLLVLPKLRLMLLWVCELWKYS